jgi:hypothetical protein
MTWGRHMTDMDDSITFGSLGDSKICFQTSRRLENCTKSTENLGEHSYALYLPLVLMFLRNIQKLLQNLNISNISG